MSIANAAHCSMMGGKRKPTAKDYVQSGLIAMWDGIENAGFGTHDPNATTWRNLTGNTTWDMTVPAAWTNNAMYFDGTWCGIAPKTSEKYVTVECVCDAVQASYPLAFGWAYQGGVKRYSLLSNASSSLLRCYSWMNAFDGVYSATARSFAFSVGDTNSKIYVDGVENATSSSHIGAAGETNNRFRLCGYGTTSDTNASGFFFKGNIYACRFYSRALTADEIAANCAIDKIRFGLT